MEYLDQIYEEKKALEREKELQEELEQEEKNKKKKKNKDKDKDKEKKLNEKKENEENKDNKENKEKRTWSKEIYMQLINNNTDQYNESISQINRSDGYWIESNIFFHSFDNFLVLYNPSKYNTVFNWDNYWADTTDILTPKDENTVLYSKKIRKNYKKAKIEDLEKAIEKSDIVEGLIPEDNDEKDEINTSSKDPENINIINNDNPKEEKTDKEVIIPVNTKEIDDKKENNENNEIINEEPKIDKKINISEDEKSENDANRKESNLSILSNNIDTGVNSSQVLSMKQKKLINKISKW